MWEFKFLFCWFYAWLFFMLHEKKQQGRVSALGSCIADCQSERKIHKILCFEEKRYNFTIWINHFVMQQFASFALSLIKFEVRHRTRMPRGWESLFNCFSFAIKLIMIHQTIAIAGETNTELYHLCNSFYSISFSLRFRRQTFQELCR